MAALATSSVQDLVLEGGVEIDSQVVWIKLFAAEASAGVHDATGVGPVLLNVHLVVMNWFDEFGDEAEQLPDATGVGPVTTVLQLVAVYPFPEFAAAGEQEAVGTLLAPF